jgi:hypothetical protein
VVFRYLCWQSTERVTHFLQESVCLAAIYLIEHVQINEYDTRYQLNCQKYMYYTDCVKQCNLYHYIYASTIGTVAILIATPMTIITATQHTLLLELC